MLGDRELHLYPPIEQDQEGSFHWLYLVGMRKAKRQTIYLLIDTFHIFMQKGQVI